MLIPACPCISSGTRLQIPNSKLIKRRVRRDKENRGSLATVFQTFIALLSGLKEGKYSTSVLNCNSIFPKARSCKEPLAQQQGRTDSLVPIRNVRANTPKTICKGQLFDKQHFSSLSLASLESSAGRLLHA